MHDVINDGQPFCRRDRAAAGLTTEKSFREAVAEGRLRLVFKGTYVDATIPDSRELRVAAVRMVAPPHAVVSDSSASWLLGVDTYRPSERFLLEPSLVVPHGASRVRLPGVRCRQAYIPDGDVMELEGILVTTPVRTASDLLRTLYRPYALAAADGLVRAEVVSHDEVWEFVQRLKRYRGAPQARELVELIDPGAESRGESWQRLRIIDAGFPRPSTQLPVVDEFGRERWFDMGYRRQRVASEYDGREHHTDKADQEHDEERRSYFERRDGWRFVIGTRERIFGTDDAFDWELGAHLGLEPLPRSWW